MDFLATLEKEKRERLDTILAKLIQIEELLPEKQHIERGLWTIKDIAEYVGLSYGHVYKFIITAPDFPKPVSLDGKGNKNKKIYLRDDVIEYVKSKRK